MSIGGRGAGGACAYLHWAWKYLIRFCRKSTPFLTLISLTLSRYWKQSGKTDWSFEGGLNGRALTSCHVTQFTSHICSWKRRRSFSISSAISPPLNSVRIMPCCRACSRFSFSIFALPHQKHMANNNSNDNNKQQLLMCCVICIFELWSQYFFSHSLVS